LGTEPTWRERHTGGRHGDDSSLALQARAREPDCDSSRVA
jgi:hypothetical protein